MKLECIKTKPLTILRLKKHIKRNPTWEEKNPTWEEKNPTWEEKNPTWEEENPTWDN